MEKLKGGKRKKIVEDLKEYGIIIKQPIYFKNNSIYLLTPKAIQLLLQIEKEKIKVFGGFYLGKMEKTGLRLSFDACQLFSNQIKKYIEIDDEKARRWFNGEDIEVKTEKEGFFVLKNKEDFIGCGFVKDGKIKNYVPKDRREK